MQRLARFTGLAYLGIVATGIFAEVAVRRTLVVDGDALATTAAIADAAGLFRAGVMADVLMVGLDVGVAVGLFALLRPVDRTLAVLAAALRLIQASVIAANLMNMLQALQLSTGGPVADALGPAATQALVLSAMDLHRVVYDLGLVFFGLSCVVLARLLWRSRLVPPALAVGVGMAGAVYLLGSTVALCLPALTPLLDPLYGVAFVSELAFAGWLLVRGASPHAAVPASRAATA